MWAVTENSTMRPTVDRTPLLTRAGMCQTLISSKASHDIERYTIFYKVPQKILGQAGLTMPHRVFASTTDKMLTGKGPPALQCEREPLGVIAISWLCRLLSQ
jgi:hypothetical protein